MNSESKKGNNIPVLIAVGVCLFFIKSGFLSFFFLAPLGFIAFKYDYRAAWKTLFLAAVGNAFMAFTLMATRGIPLGQAFWDILYFTVMTLIFTWIVAPPPRLQNQMSADMRLLAGSCLGALLFTAIFFRIMASPGFAENVASWIHVLGSFNRSSGTDVVQTAMIESLNTELVLDAMRSLMLRGASLISCIFLFFVSRQISLTVVHMSRRERASPFFTGVHVYPLIIWVFSASLLLVVLTRIINLEIPEIILWNILILCAILYLAQGLGILQFFLTRPAMPPFLRLSVSILFVVLLFSPVINAVLLAGIVLLGIAENWVGFRTRDKNGPPSTPEAGNGGN